MEKVNILGVNVSALNKKQVLEKIDQFLIDGKQHQIATPNPEFLLETREDEEFFYVLNKADLAVPDGIGLKFAGWLLGRDLKRLAGVDLLKELLEIADKRNFKIAIINWSKALSSEEDLKQFLKTAYPRLIFKIFNIHKEAINTPFKKESDEYQLKEKISVQPQRSDFFEEINEFKPDIAIVTFGAPYQDKFIYHSLPLMPAVKVAMGVGGAFDFFTGKAQRAPGLMRLLGLEWFWRLIKQPWRRKRIYRAVIIFPWKFFKWRFIKRFFYRPSVVCMAFKKEGGKYKILLLNRQGDIEHWQLPQGGTDGEDLITAGLRELREEIGTDKFKVSAVFKNLLKYKFGSRYGKFGVKLNRGLGYKGQKQGLLIAEFLGEDKDIKINFWDHKDWTWVDSDKVVDKVHELRKESTEMFMERFKEFIINNKL